MNNGTWNNIYLDSGLNINLFYSSFQNITPLNLASMLRGRSRSRGRSVGREEGGRAQKVIIRVKQGGEWETQVWEGRRKEGGREAVIREVCEKVLGAPCWRCRGEEGGREEGRQRDVRSREGWSREGRRREEACTAHRMEEGEDRQEGGEASIYFPAAKMYSL